MFFRGGTIAIYFYTSQNKIYQYTRGRALNQWKANLDANDFEKLMGGDN